MLIDKLQKRLGVIQAYEDSDLVEYLTRGAELVNSGYPTTYFGYATMPQMLTVHHLLFSGWYALQAQGLLSTEVSFSFCVDENTLLPSEHGLIRARSLIEEPNYRYEITKKIVGEKGISIIEELAMSEFHNPLHISNIIKCLKTEITQDQLKSLMGKLQIADRKQDAFGWWDLKNVGQELSNKFLINTFASTQTKLLTPYGYEQPTNIFRFENKKCLEISTALGYPLTTTYNHPFLVLNTTTFEMEWKRADALRKGDLIAINKNIPEGEGITSLSRYKDLIEDVSLKQAEKCILPDNMSKELARVLGYLIAEGDLVSSDTTIRFSNSNENIIQDYVKCIVTCFPSIKPLISESDNKAGYGDPNNKKLMYIVQFNSVRIRRFLYCLGVTYVKATEKTIPEAILVAPLEIAGEFLKAFVEGDGCYSKHAKEDNSELQACLFCSHSRNLLIDIQMLLLRFGIISTFQWNDNNKCVRISGKSLSEYVQKVGFLFKGSDYNFDKTYFTPLRESMPELYYALKNNVRPLLGLNSKGWKNKKRYKVYWHHNANACINIRWEHIDKWWLESQEAIKELNPEVHTRLAAFVDSKFLWKPVAEIVEVGYRNVIDPSFESHGRILDHAFQSGGIITHNSGQSVTLDYDQAGGLADVAGRWLDFLNSTLSATKMSILRRASPVGVVAGRKYRYNDLNMYTYKIASVSGATNRILGQMTTLGLLF
jgi:intein/homing endonuclease